MNPFIVYLGLSCLFGCSVFPERSVITENSKPNQVSRFAHPGCKLGEPISFRFENHGEKPLHIPNQIDQTVSDTFNSDLQKQNIRLDACAKFDNADQVFSLEQILYGKNLGSEEQLVTVHSVKSFAETAFLDNSLFGEIKEGNKIWLPFIAGFFRGVVVIGDPISGQFFFSPDAIEKNGQFRASNWLVGRLVPGDLLFGERRCEQGEIFAKDQWNAGSAKIEAEVCQTSSTGEGSMTSRALVVQVVDEDPHLPAALKGKREFFGSKAQEIYESVQRHHGCNPFQRLTLPEVTYLLAKDTRSGEIHEMVQYLDGFKFQKTNLGPANLNLVCDAFSFP